MKTCIVTNIWLDGGRIQKAQRMLDWYRQPELFDILKWERYYFLDNGSKAIKAVAGSDILSFYPHLDHGDHEHKHDYPHSWRAIYSLRSLLDQFEKIIWLDDDAFILSARIARYISELKEGFTGFWCPKYQFPEGAFFVINRHIGQQVLERWCAQKPWSARLGELWENSLPYTRIVKTFNCDRWGETKDLQRPEMDSIHQVQLDHPLQFDMIGACGKIKAPI